jgi:phosphoribosylamine-glycine ligase
LPFLRESDLAEARQITEEVLAALKKKTGALFKGVMYGGFMATSDGVKLIEYNARFGDPEAMNVLPILKTDFIDLLQAVADGTLGQLAMEWENKATVVKYIVPEGYPNTPISGEELKIFGLPEGGRMYYAAVSMDDDGRIRTSASRAIGFVGIADTLASAERIAEAGAKSVEGKVFHRRDVGTEMLINRRVMHMLKLRK